MPSSFFSNKKLNYDTAYNRSFKAALVTGRVFKYLLVLFSAIFFAIPRTALLGAVLITAYLGGAAAVTLISKLDGHPYLFPMIFCVLLWAAEYLQSLRLRGVLPIIKHHKYVISSLPG